MEGLITWRNGSPTVENPQMEKYIRSQPHTIHGGGGQEGWMYTVQETSYQTKHIKTARQSDSQTLGQSDLVRHSRVRLM